jgi:DNA-binding CsgD family transcriptional regulator
MLASPEKELPRPASWHDAVYSLIVRDRFAPALRELERAHDYRALMLRADLHMRLGDLTRAEADARRLHEIGVNWPLAEVMLEHGELDAAERLLDGLFTGPWAAHTRGRLRLAQGRTSEGVAELRECARRAEALEIENPAVLPWRSSLAHATGDRDLAYEEVDRARAFGAPRAIGIALRVAAGHDVTILREAIGVLDRTEARLERARAHAALGAALRRAGNDEDAREPLRLAVDLAHRCRATALEEEALAELRATGARPRRRLATGAGALTPSERKVAELAAAGRLNREIAEILVVTMATVEYHLRNAYRKLGIASRTQLTTAL